MASRYNSYDSRSSVTSSIHSDLSSSSAEFKSNKPVSSKAIVRSKTSYLTKATKTVKADNNNPGNLTCMMKKLMEMKKSNSKSKKVELVVPEELKKIDTVRGGGGKSTLGTLQRKLFGKEKVKALTEVKGNTRTLSMVLRSERELLSMNKDQESEIADLKLQLEEKNREVEKLKDLCLKQREEIKSLKSAVLFPDTMNSQISQMHELNEARQIIPNLQKQVISLSGQLQCIAQDLAEVKANKYMAESCYWQAQTSSYDSLELSSGSADGLALEDLNPCLTPYTKKKPKDFERIDSAEESLSGRSTITTTGGKVNTSATSVKLSRSSETKTRQRSEETKEWYRGRTRMF